MSGIAEKLFAEKNDPRTYKRLISVDDLIKFEDNLPSPSGGSITANHGNTTYVSTGGSDTTGEVGNISKPFETLQAAIDALDSGSLGQVIILSSTGSGQTITSIDQSGAQPTTMSIINLSTSDITVTGALTIEQLYVSTTKSFIVNLSSGMINVSDWFDLRCKLFAVPGTNTGDITWNGLIECDVFTTNSNASNPTYTFDRIQWNNAIYVIEPITYTRCNPMVWKGRITQAGIADPVVAQVLENKFGETLSLTRTSDGRYTLTSPGGKFNDKMNILFSITEILTPFSMPIYSWQRDTLNEVTILCWESVGFFAGDYLGQNTGTVITIEVYP